MRSLLIVGAVVAFGLLPPTQGRTQGSELFALELVAPAELPSTGRRDGRATYLDQPSRLFRVGSMEPGQRYPLVVVLPWTGGTSEQMWSRLEGLIPVDAYYVLLTPGSPSRSDYLPRFYDYVSWLDERVGADLEQAGRQHSVDAERIYLTGFSVGGDAGWALLLRHPERYRGALVLGARSSARPRRGARQALRERDLRIAFAIGDSDDAARRRGITRANETAREYGVETRFETFAGHHGTPRPELMRSLLEFVFANDQSPRSRPGMRP